MQEQINKAWAQLRLVRNTIHGKKADPQGQVSLKESPGGSLVAMALDCLILCWAEILWEEGESPALHHPCPEHSSCMCELPHLSSLLAAVQLIWVAWDLRNPPDAASPRISPALQQPCQGKNAAQHQGLWNGCFWWISNRDFTGCNPASWVCS